MQDPIETGTETAAPDSPSAGRDSAASAGPYRGPCPSPSAAWSLVDRGEAWGVADTRDEMIQRNFGAPVAIADADGDGQDELWFTLRTGGLWRQEWTGEGLSEPELVIDTGAEVLTLLLGDFSGDGQLDWIWGGSRNQLVLQLGQGDGSFLAYSESGLDQLELASTVRHISSADWDQDGDLDLHLALGSGPKVPSAPHCDRFLRAEGEGRFVDVSEWVDLDTRCGSGWGGAWSDLDRDGDLDLFVVNADQDRFGPSRLYENLGVDGEGRWRFEDRSETCLCAHQAGAMGVSPGDYDRDGWMDLYLTNTGPSQLLWNYRDGSFIDTTLTLGAGALTDEAAMSFGSVFADLDQDGWLDIALAAGPLSANAPIASQPQEQADVLLMGSASGFTDVSEAMGFGNLEAGRGVSYGDLNGDGFPELVVSHAGGSLGIFEAQCTEARSLQVSLQGRDPNRFGVGAWIEVQAGGQSWHREISTSAGHASVIHPRAWFGLGQREPEQLIVRWPDGLVQELALQPDTWAITVERP